jgi:hypothetical protein
MIGSHYQDSLVAFNNEFAAGALEYADAVTYHTYNYDETMSMQRALALKGLTKHYGKDIEVVQGEMGSQSKSGGNGALSWIRTNQDMQTKYLLRHIVAEVMSGVKFTSYFSSVDMAENLDAKAGAPITTCGYFGLLGAEFDRNTGTLVGDYYEKPSYYAFRNLCSLFDEKSTVGTLIRVMGGLLLSFVILSPVTNWNFDAVASFAESFESAGNLAAETGSNLAAEEAGLIIREELSAYILDKAADLQTDLQVEILLSNDSIPTPESVTLIGTVTPYAKIKLQKILEQELGIPKERQIWTG